MKEIIIQVIGFVAMFLTITAYQYKKRVFILLSQYSGNAVWCVHYFLLASYTGVMMNFINVLRGIIFSIDKKWAKSIAWVFVFCIMSIVLGLITFDKWFSVLPIIGTLIATVALFIKKENTLRKVYIISVPFWIAYNILAHSIPATLSSLFTLVSLVVALIRYRKAELPASSLISPNNNSTAVISDAVQVDAAKAEATQDENLKQEELNKEIK